MRPSAAPEPGRAGASTTQPAWMLTLATVGFTLGFWAWALLAPLGPSLRKELDLTSFRQSLAVAVPVPVLIGSLGRIPVGGSPPGRCSAARRRRSGCLSPGNLPSPTRWRSEASSRSAFTFRPT